MMQDSITSIAVDIDDVLFDFVGYFFDWHNRHYGSQITPADMTHIKIWEAWGGTQEQAAERIPAFFRDPDYLSIPPLPDAVETLSRMKERYDLTLLSARSASTRGVTELWLDRHFPGLFEDIHLGIGDPLRPPDEATKAAFCTAHDISLLIDDQLKHALEGAEAGIRIYLFGDSPWNQQDDLPTGVMRVADWKAVAENLLT